MGGGGERAPQPRTQAARPSPAWLTVPHAERAVRMAPVPSEVWQAMPMALCTAPCSPDQTSDRTHLADINGPRADDHVGLEVAALLDLWRGGKAARETNVSAAQPAREAAACAGASPARHRGTGSNVYSRSLLGRSVLETARSPAALAPRSWPPARGARHSRTRLGPAPAGSEERGALHRRRRRRAAAGAEQRRKFMAPPWLATSGLHVAFASGLGEGCGRNALFSCPRTCDLAWRPWRARCRARRRAAWGRTPNQRVFIGAGAPFLGATSRPCMPAADRPCMLGRVFSSAARAPLADTFTAIWQANVETAVQSLFEAALLADCPAHVLLPHETRKHDVPDPPHPTSVMAYYLRPLQYAPSSGHSRVI